MRASKLLITKERLQLVVLDSLRDQTPNLNSPVKLLNGWESIL